MFLPSALVMRMRIGVDAHPDALGVVVLWHEHPLVDLASVGEDARDVVVGDHLAEDGELARAVSAREGSRQATLVKRMSPMAVISPSALHCWMTAFTSSAICRWALSPWLPCAGSAWLCVGG